MDYEYKSDFTYVHPVKEERVLEVDRITLEVLHEMTRVMV